MTRQCRIVSFIVDVKRQIIPWIRARWNQDDGVSNRETAEDRISKLYGEPDDEQ